MAVLVKGQKYLHQESTDSWYIYDEVLANRADFKVVVYGGEAVVEKEVVEKKVRKPKIESEFVAEVGALDLDGVLE